MKNEGEFLAKKIGFVSLGCDKNRVDTENMITELIKAGFIFAGEREQANIIIINTCAFLEVARQEAVDAILEIAKLKHIGNLEKIIVTGCLPLLDFANLKTLFPEVDAFLVPKDYNNIADIIYKLYGEVKPKFEVRLNHRILTTPTHYAYIKIADGCNNFCSFCKIPYIRGRYNSRTIEDIVKEVELLVKYAGVKEILLVAQDVTKYGIDLYKEFKLVALLKELSKIKDLNWIRLHYCYPEMISDELIAEIKNNNKIVKYIDIPFQHINTKILNLMGRQSTDKSIKELIDKLRAEVPNIVIRATFMVGFPGENAFEFKQLCNFLKEYKLDNVGFFAYSREEGTKASLFRRQVPKFIKNRRLKIIQKVQQSVVEQKFVKFIGNTWQVVCDYFDEERQLFVCRPSFFSPEVDFCVVVSTDFNIKAGDMFNVVIKSFENFEFKGEIL